MTSMTISIDGKSVQAAPGQTILSVCKENGIDIPTMCYFKGLTNVGACRLCLVEIEGSPKLTPACTTPVVANQRISTNTEKLQRYRKMITELFFAERNHICAVCVANNDCDLQAMAKNLGVVKVRFPYLYQKCEMDGTHPKFNIDHNRCILCTRCVRVCDEVEGAHNWDVMGRGYSSRIIADFNQPWAESTTCTSCGKCVNICPTGALWSKDSATGRLEKNPTLVEGLIQKKGALS